MQLNYYVAVAGGGRSAGGAVKLADLDAAFSLQPLINRAADPGVKALPLRRCVILQSVFVAAFNINRDPIVCPFLVFVYACVACFSAFYYHLGLHYSQTR